MKGIIKWYNIKRGYGFIKGEDGDELFIHKSEIPFWTIFLYEGDTVEYNKQNTNRGMKAIKLKLIKRIKS